jgi:uncharacterized protein YjbJ (UPF0337 family)
MTRLQEKARGRTKQAVGQMIGDDRLVREGEQQVRQAEGERSDEAQHKRKGKDRARKKTSGRSR